MTGEVSDSGRNDGLCQPASAEVTGTTGRRRSGDENSPVGVDTAEQLRHVSHRARVSTKEQGWAYPSLSRNHGSDKPGEAAEHRDRPEQPYGGGHPSTEFFTRQKYLPVRGSTLPPKKTDAEIFDDDVGCSTPQGTQL